MKNSVRRMFDAHVDAVLETLPRQIHVLLETVPLHVEDRPSREVRHEMRLGPYDDLYGLYTGTPMTERHVGATGLPDVVTIYRESILDAATREDGTLDDDTLREEIRITILHELGHHYGFTEDDLEELGY